MNTKQKNHGQRKLRDVAADLVGSAMCDKHAGCVPYSDRYDEESRLLRFTLSGVHDFRELERVDDDACLVLELSSSAGL